MENPTKAIVTHPLFMGQSGETGVKMSKFRELMLKFYRTNQKQPLSEAHNSIVEKRLDLILPLLNHTPDHPPYAWMIQKALEELARKRGSSEDLISDYIKKKYKDLPWAHDTLLSHHLKNLCVSGEIVLTKNQKYIFPGLLSVKKPSEKITKNKHVGKEQDGDLLSKKKKKNKPQKAARKQYKVKRDDKDHVVAGKRPSCNPEGHVLNEVPEGQDVLNEVSEGHVFNEVPKGHVVLNEVRDMEIVEICSSDTQEFAVVAPELSCDAELKQVQLEVSDDTKNQRGEWMLVASDGTTETLDEYMQALEPITNISKFGIQQIECGKHLDVPTQTKPTEVLYQQTIPDLIPTTDEKKTCFLQSNPVRSSGTDQVRHVVCKYEFRIPDKIAKENQTKKLPLDKCDPVIEQGQKQLDAQDSEPIDVDELQLLPGSGKGLQFEGTTGGMQRKLRSGKLLSEQGTGRMQRKLLRSCNNKYAKQLKKNSNESSDDDDDDDDYATPLKLEYRGRGRSRKVNSEEEEVEQQQQIVEMESEKPKKNKKRGRGRPPNPKSKKRKVVIRNNDNPEIHRGRGRPRKNIIQ